jgi:hypothetical protein
MWKTVDPGESSGRCAGLQMSLNAAVLNLPAMFSAGNAAQGLLWLSRNARNTAKRNPVKHAVFLSDPVITDSNVCMIGAE